MIEVVDKAITAISRCDGIRRLDCLTNEKKQMYHLSADGGFLFMGRLMNENMLLVPTAYYTCVMNWQAHAISL